MFANIEISHWGSQLYKSQSLCGHSMHHIMLLPRTMACTSLHIIAPFLTHACWIAPRPSCIILAHPHSISIQGVPNHTTVGGSRPNVPSIREQDRASLWGIQGRTLQACRKVLLSLLLLFVTQYLRMQVGSLPDQVPSSRHTLTRVPLTKYPSTQLYVAVDPMFVSSENLMDPLDGMTREGHCTAEKAV